MDVRCLMVFQGGSGLSEDRYVNTLHFTHAGTDLQAIANELTTVLTTFWNTVPGGGLQAIGRMLSEYISRAAEFRFYNLADPEPRVPEIRTWTLGAAVSPGGPPEEAAVVLSLRGGIPVTPRRRGRIYIGPLGGAALLQPTPTTPSGVNPDFQSAIALSATRLRTEVLALPTDAVWVIRSTVPAQNFVPIEGGWIDNAPDTQRRRGPSPTSRFLWGEPL